MVDNKIYLRASGLEGVGGTGKKQGPWPNRNSWAGSGFKWGQKPGAASSFQIWLNNSFWAGCLFRVFSSLALEEERLLHRGITGPSRGVGRLLLGWGAWAADKFAPFISISVHVELVNTCLRGERNKECREV